MKLSEIQGKIKTLIETAAAVGGSKLADIEITVEGETDGSGALVDLDKAIADGMLASGLHIGILYPSTGESDTSHSQSGKGISSMWSSIPVLLAENPEINRDAASGGLNLNPIQVIEELITAVLFKPVGPAQNGFRLASEPFFKAENEAGFMYFSIFQARTHFTSN